jgi:6-pyruvoyltetrahydropterin/6-carboxytetrahydropterin synthase
MNNLKEINLINRKVLPKNERLFSGYSACFRQWRADGTHCKYLHSYVLTFKVTFDQDVSSIFLRGKKQRHKISKWFKNTFDKTTFVAADDPYLDIFNILAYDKAIKLKVIDKVGCEMFSEFVLINLNKLLEELGEEQRVISVETFEHNKNSALYIK